MWLTFDQWLILVIIHQNKNFTSKMFAMSCVHVSNANCVINFFFDFHFVLYISIYQKFTTHFTHLCPQNHFIVNEKYLHVILLFQ
jgi:hypothetical protein